MKKIVALALCLVLALSLCATAFAAETTTEIKKDGYSLMDMNNAAVTMTADEFDKTVKDAKVVTEGSKTTTTYFADEYVIEVDDADVTYYACDASIAEYKLVKGTSIVYLTTANLSAGTSKVATAFIEAKDAEDQECGDVTADCYTISGKNYSTDGTDLAVLNGKFVMYDKDTTVENKGHEFTKAGANKTGYFTTDTKGTIVSVKCDNCKKSFTVVKEVAKDYTGKVEAFGTKYVLLGSATAAEEAAGVTSAKTFDAGIAMYVGMSLMAVTGSAVVIGKKKEF